MQPHPVHLPEHEAPAPRLRQAAWSPHRLVPSRRSRRSLLRTRPTLCALMLRNARSARPQSMRPAPCSTCRLTPGAADHSSGLGPVHPVTHAVGSFCSTPPRKRKWHRLRCGGSKRNSRQSSDSRSSQSSRSPSRFRQRSRWRRRCHDVSPLEQVVWIRRPCIHRKTFCDPIPDLPRGALVHVWPSEWRYVGNDGVGAADEFDVRAINPLGLLPR